MSNDIDMYKLIISFPLDIDNHRGEEQPQSDVTNLVK